MALVNDKDHILAALHAELRLWEDLLANMSETQISARVSPEQWSLKDVIAHLHAWQQVSIARLEAALHNTEPKLPVWLAGQDSESEEHLPQFNATIYERSRDAAWSDVYQRWRDGFLRFIALADDVPEQDLLAVDKYAWIEGYALVAVLEGSLEHHREHREEHDALDPF